MGYRNELSLLGTDISDRGLANLQKMAQLRQLNIRSTCVSNAGIIELEKAIPALQIKWEGNRLTKIGKEKKILEKKSEALEKWQ